MFIVRKRVYVIGHKYVLAPTKTTFSLCQSAKVKVSFEIGPKHFSVQECKLYHYYCHFGGH